jgi:8-oxo-dGTP pyrophosphatase MutT (NUDIX family)
MPPPPPTTDKKKAPDVPRPSSSVLLISPQNQVLLLQRVKQSSSFPSAHVFPGGNVSTSHDGASPSPSSPSRHEDSAIYRLAAIRETFEESGILLARNNGFGRLLEVPEAEREAGRKAVHANEVAFTKWLAGKGGRADVEGLIPFTRWVTPTNVPRRFTTQMYLYFLPTTADSAAAGNERLSEAAESEAEVVIPAPTTDGGKEHTTARFLPAAAWCRLAQEGRLIMFPPQFLLLHLVAQFLDGLSAPSEYSSLSSEAVGRAELEARRKRLVEFVTTTGEPVRWTDMCISPGPVALGKKREDGRQVMGLHKPGVELEQMPGAKRQGCGSHFVLTRFTRDGPRDLAVLSREEALEAGAKL